MAFKQPEGKPSYITYFNATIRLSQIQSYALRTIVSQVVTRLGLLLICFAVLYLEVQGSNGSYGPQLGGAYGDGTRLCVEFVGR